MYELSRVRLFSVGPAGARYSDVVLDFSDVGAAVRAPAQEALFDANPAQPARRPSPASVLFLENGGGKSVLIKLIFSVMLPGRRQVVGTTNTRVLEKFVRAGDVAHVLLEWQHTETGARVITGKVSEWRGHVVSTDPAKLIDAWYSFRPTQRFTLDTLPLTDDGRLRTLSGFHERLTESHRDEPELQAAWETGHADWAEHLANLGLDTELFRYQRAMNAGEGEAADAFTFKTDDAFVDFLLRAVLDEEDPRGLADVVEGYAHKLAQRGQLIAERDFVAGALERMSPLAAQEEQAGAARKLAQGARIDTERFSAAVAARNAGEMEGLDTARATRAGLAEDEQQADRDMSRLNAIVLELRRLVAGMRLHDARQEKDSLASDLERAKTVVDGWRETETVLQAITAVDRANGLRALVGEQEERARPALEARNASARALARALLSTAGRADTDADTADRAAGTLHDRENQVRAEYDDAMSRAATARERARNLEIRIAEVRAKTQAAVRAGLLADGADVAMEAAATEQAADGAAQEFTDALTERDRLADAVSEAGDAVSTAQRTADTAANNAERAAEAAAKGLAIVELLTGKARLAELLGVETVALDSDTPELLRLLATAIDTAEAATAELRAADLDDRRALDALGEGGLLPAPEDVSATVDTLLAEKITAWPGWRYLSTVAPEEREAVLERYPHLVDGVVINDPKQIEHAYQVMTDARLLPRTIVAIGTTAAINTDSPGAPAGIAFLVPPNPAMYDEDAAEAERIAIAQRDDQHRRDIARYTAQASEDRELSGQLTRFSTDYPPGSVTRLVGERDARAAALAAAEDMFAEFTEKLGVAKSAEAECRQRIPHLQAEADRLRNRADRLTALAVDVARIAPWTTETAHALDEVTGAERSAEQASGRVRDLREQAEAKTREADGHRRVADGCRDELAGVLGGGSVDESDPVPAEPLDALRRASRAAAEAYAKVEVGSDLRADLEHAEAAESQTRSAVEALAKDIRALAAELIATPDGADPPARAAAGRRAQAQVGILEGQVNRATERVAVLRTEYGQFTPQDRSLEPYGRPRDIEHGEELITVAQRDWEQARTRYDRLKAARSRIESVLARAEEAVNGFAAVLDSLHGITSGEPDPEVAPFEGDVALARTRRNDLRRNLDDAQSLLADAEQEVRRAADDLAQYATDERFEEVTTPVRRQMIAVRRDELPAYAADWEQALRPRLRTLDDDLAQINRHRTSIIERLTGMVDAALRTLRSAQRLSTLPVGLGDWSGQEFLRVKFDDVEDNILTERLGEVIDEAAGQAPNATQQTRRDGISLLLRGVHAAVPKGFRVEMLKPDAVLRTERLRVSEIRDVFSGGQQLTAAIILYCTLAALRANNRGRARHRHSGVLFLDNPIGRASAGYLLELQLAVADALGVQLIYTTGLFDAGALSVFPLIIRLRNDADLRAGLKYLSVDSIIRRQLEELGEPDGTARLDATRVYVRPTPAS